MPNTLISRPPPDVHVLQSDAEAIAAAHRYAAAIRPAAVQRDRDRLLPYAELEQLARSGLLALRVPRSHGGPGASAETVAEVTRIISVADPAIGQIPQNHLAFSDIFNRVGTEEQRRFFFAEVLRGARLGNALSERGTKMVLEFKTRVTADGNGGYRLNGRKYYSTGALTAQWIPVFALDGSDELVIAYVPRDTDGVTVEQDWTSFGQRATISGSTILEDVAVEEWQILRGIVGSRTTFGAFGQLIHAAVDVGIARGAFEDGVAFIKTRTRPWFEAGVQRAVDEPHLILKVGTLATRLDAAEALVRRSAQLVDAVEAQAHPSADEITEARLAVAGAKAFAGEVALQISTEILELAGTAATDEEHGFDRHWRNARTHTLHDANRWKYHHIGNWVLQGIAPAAENPLI